MDKHLPTRFEQIDSLFASSKKDLRVLAVKDGLNKEERSAYEKRLRRWFHGFAARPGNERRRVELLRGELLSAADEFAAEFKEFFREWNAAQGK